MPHSAAFDPTKELGFLAQDACRVLVLVGGALLLTAGMCAANQPLRHAINGLAKSVTRGQKRYERVADRYVFLQILVPCGLFAAAWLAISYGLHTV